LTVTDGAISQAAVLSVTVVNAALNAFTFAAASPQINAVAFTGANTLTAIDAYGNAVTGFNASTTNVTITTTLPGAVSALSGNTATGYTGDKTLTFSGANASPNSTNPTVTSKTGAAVNFGTAETITFTNGVSSAGGSMKLYKKETASVTVSDGTINSTAGPLSVTVVDAGLNAFTLTLVGPQTNGVAFTGTNSLTAIDAYGNTV